MGENKMTNTYAQSSDEAMRVLSEANGLGFQWNFIMGVKLQGWDDMPEEFDSKIIASFEVPKEVPKFRQIDRGIANPFYITSAPPSVSLWGRFCNWLAR